MVSELDEKDATSLQESPSWWRRLLPWGMALAITTYLVVKTDHRSLIASLRSVSLVQFIGFIFAFSIINLLCDTLATWKTYRTLQPSLAFRSIFVVRGASYLPSIVNYHAGQAYLTYLLSKRHGIPLSQVVGGTLLVYATTLSNLILLAGCSLLLPATHAPWVSWFVTLLVLGILFYFVVIKIRPSILERISFLAPLFAAGPRKHLRLMAWRIPHIATLFLSLWITYWFFHVSIPWRASLAALPLILLASALPITPQGAGTREIMAIQLLSPFVPPGDTNAPIIAAGGAFVMTTTLNQALIGLVLFSKSRKMLQKN